MLSLTDKKKKLQKTEQRKQNKATLPGNRTPDDSLRDKRYSHWTIRYTLDLD